MDPKSPSVESTTPALSLGPRSVERPADAGWTLVGGIDDAQPSRVDGGGLVAPSGATWLVDWWIGADDRWYLPASEPSIRQNRRGPGPVIETSMRVPSGDVVATAFPVVAGSRRATAVEITNDSPVPVVLAIALRPVGLDGGAPRPHRVELLDGPAIAVDGAPAVLLPRVPNEAVADRADDVLERVCQGRDLVWDGPVDGPAANGAVLYPLPHSTSLRFTVLGPGPGGGVGPDGTDSTEGTDGLAGLRPAALPPVDGVVRGWATVIDRASSFRFPDSGLTDLVGAARARLVLASAGLAPGIEAIDVRSARILEALAKGGHAQECRPSLEALAAGFPRRLPADTDEGPGVVAAAVLVRAVAAAADLLEPELAEALLAPVAQLTALVERGRRSPAPAVAVAKLGLARLVARAGQLDAADHLMATVARSTIEEPDGGGVGVDPARLTADEVAGLAQQAAPSGAWPPGDGAGAAARFFTAARTLLIDDAGPPTDSDPNRPNVRLLPEMPTAWMGGEVEVHRAPAAGVRVSYAIRWHGYRPALLWQVDPSGDSSGDPGGDPNGAPNSAAEPVWPRLSCPGLDPAWSTDQPSGEILLAGAADALPPAPEPGESFA